MIQVRMAPEADEGAHLAQEGVSEEKSLCHQSPAAVAVENRDNNRHVRTSDRGHEVVAEDGSDHGIQGQTGQLQRIRINSERAAKGRVQERRQPQGDDAEHAEIQLISTW